MEIKIIMLINLLAYSFVVSQPLSYIIAMRNVQRNLQISSYIEIRKLLDKNYQAKFKIVIYFSLFTCTVLTILSSMHLSGMLFITSVIALGALIVEIFLALTGNVPINKIINTWTTEDHPSDWRVYRRKWLAVFTKRQIVNLIGFISLAIGAVFAS